jgi:hypothetical protein
VRKKALRYLSRNAPREHQNSRYLRYPEGITKFLLMITKNKIVWD